MQEKPILPEVVKALYEKHAKRCTHPSSRELSEAFCSVVDTYSRVFFVIDALDECTNIDRTREGLLREILKLCGQKGTSLFATSRFATEIEKEFESHTSIEIRASDEDIQRYLDEQIPQLLGRRIFKYPDLEDTIRRDVLKAVDRMFLLAQLHMDSLISQPTRGDIRRALRSLPQGIEGLDHTYD